MANNILKYKGHNIGKSICEENCDNIIDEIFKSSKNFSCSLIYPEDVVIGKSINSDPIIKSSKEVESDDLILDIGPRTTNKIINIIENSKSILWNGPAGYFENPHFAQGRYEIGKKLQKKILKKIFSQL